jgi:hypothetical protein
MDKGVGPEFKPKYCQKRKKEYNSPPSSVGPTHIPCGYLKVQSGVLYIPWLFSIYEPMIKFNLQITPNVRLKTSIVAGHW